MFFCCCKKRNNNYFDNNKTKKLIINNNILLSIDIFELLSNDCAICLESLVSGQCIYANNCNHVFHYNCFINYLMHNKEKKKKLFCPLCYEDQTILLT